MQEIHDILGQYLYDKLIDNLNQNNYSSLEIGVFNGAGTALIGRTFPKRKIYAVDPFIEDGNTNWITKVEKGNLLNKQKENFYNNIKDLSNVVLFEETSEEFSKKINKEKINEMNIGWVIIDGDHNYEQVIIDCELAIKLIDKKENSGIIFDDLHIPDVQKAIDVFTEKYNNIIASTEHFHGAGAVIIKLY